MKAQDPSQAGGRTRDDASVRMERELANKARLIATRRGLTIGEIVTNAARKAIEHEYANLIRELSGEL